MMLLIYFAAVLYITVLSREPEGRRYDMEPFRSYSLLLDGNGFYFNQIFYNILMTVPFGMLVPLVSKKIRTLPSITFAGFCFSFAIELTQYITGRGLFEFDDLFNNTIGAVLGYIFFLILSGVMIIYLRGKK
jgi:glycopeptide antibiotics resistance protein